jgi:hypothetical protein
MRIFGICELWKGANLWERFGSRFGWFGGSKWLRCEVDIGGELPAIWR